MLGIDCMPNNSDKNTWKALLDKASSTFPSTESLSLRFRPLVPEPLTFGGDPLTFMDLSTSFLTHNHLTSFSLSSVPLSLTSKDLANIIMFWPHLETFVIDYDWGRYPEDSPFSLEVLIAFSILPHLCELVLPLDFTIFPKLLATNIKNIIRGKAPLRTLETSSFIKPPELLGEKIVLVNYLLRLFPSLFWILNNDSESFKDLECLISAYREYYELESENNI